MGGSGCRAEDGVGRQVDWGGGEWVTDENGFLDSTAGYWHHGMCVNHSTWRRPSRGGDDARRSGPGLGSAGAGVGVVSGYPGSPATGVFDALLARTAPGDLQIGWAPNEKVAMEIAIGASLGGARSLVVLKSVGMNIGLDPLATMTYTGCHKGMVILLGDDPGAWGSQNEQDSRWLARVAEVPVVEPTSVAQAAALMAQAFVWSESLGVPVIVRIVGSLALSRSEERRVGKEWRSRWGPERSGRK